MFALVLGVLWLPLALLQARQLSARSITPEHREVLERRATAPSALVIPGSAALLLLLGAWFAVRADSDDWWVWLASGLLFVVNLALAVRLRRRVTE
mgnify:CR=1 FL=1